MSRIVQPTNEQLKPSTSKQDISKGNFPFLATMNIASSKEHDSITSHKTLFHINKEPDHNT